MGTGSQVARYVPSPCCGLASTRFEHKLVVFSHGLFLGFFLIWVDVSKCRLVENQVGIFEGP